MDNSGKYGEDLEILTLSEVCEILRISKPTLNRYIKLGKLKTVRAKRKVFITKLELYNFLHS